MIEIFKSISLDNKLKSPLYMQLYRKLKDMISDGTLVPGFRLPSVRKLSSTLNINSVTVVSAYKILENDGFIYSKPGSGTYIGSMLPFKNIKDQLSDDAVIDEMYQDDDFDLVGSGHIKTGKNTINFASATPTPDLFPVDDFKTVLNEVLDRDMGNAFGYHESQGFYPLRESIAWILGKNKFDYNINELQIISGSQQGLDIISKIFLNQGDYVITESPTYTGATAVFKSRGANIIQVEYENDGPNLNILEYNLKKYRPKLIYTIPSFQNPTGYSYSIAKRKEILELAQKYDCFIIEDDYVRDLDFEEKNFPTLKSIDKYNRVIFIKSFTNLFMPGIRLGFMIAPPRLTANLLKAKHTSDISTSGLLQRALDLYIRKGFWDKHYKFIYETYSQRYYSMIDALDKNLPSNVSYFKPGGGLNIWLCLPYGFPINNLLNNVSKSDIIFAPGTIFYSSGTPLNANNIRLSFSSVSSNQIEQGIPLLCENIKSLK